MPNLNSLAILRGFFKIKLTINRIFLTELSNPMGSIKIVWGQNDSFYRA